MTFLLAVVAVLAALAVVEKLVDSGHLDWLPEVLDAPLRPTDEDTR